MSSPASPLIFLDIDGVLATERSISRLTGSERGIRYYLNQLDRECIKEFASIIDRTGARVVLSSIWRHDDDAVDALEEAFSQEGLPGNLIIGKTPTLPERDGEDPRGKEISAWLEEYGIDVKYVCIDDDEIYGHPLVHVYQGHTAGGLQTRHAERAVDVIHRKAIKDRFGVELKRGDAVLFCYNRRWLSGTVRDFGYAHFKGHVRVDDGDPGNFNGRTNGFVRSVWVTGRSIEFLRRRNKAPMMKKKERK